MRKILFIIPFFLWTCSEGPTEPKAPLAYNLSLTTNEDTALTFTFEDISNSSAISISSNTKNGVLTLSGSSATYTPNDNFNGIDTFSYIVVNNGLNSNTADAEIIVLPVNDAPTAYDKNGINVYNEQTIEIILEAEDLENDNLSFEIIDNPENGSVYINGNIAVLSAQTIGNDSFTFRANDGAVNSNIATITYEILKPRVLFGENYRVLGINLKDDNYEVIGGKDGSILKVIIDSNGDILENNFLSSSISSPDYRSFKKIDGKYVFQQDYPRIIEKFDSNGGSEWNDKPSSSHHITLSKAFSGHYAFNGTIYADNGVQKNDYYFHCDGESSYGCVPSTFNSTNMNRNSENIFIGDNNGSISFVVGSRNGYLNAARIEFGAINTNNEMRVGLVWGLTLFTPEDVGVTHTYINKRVTYNSGYLRVIVKFPDSGLYKQWIMNDDGEIIFEQNLYSSNEPGHTADMINTLDSGYIICGRLSIDQPADEEEAFQMSMNLLKFDSNGNLEWSKEFPDILNNLQLSTEQRFFIVQNSNGEFIIAMNIFDIDEKSKILVMKTDNNGNLIF